LSYDARDKGLRITFKYNLDTQDWSVDGFFVCGPKCEGFPKWQPYPGKLPNGVTLDDRREELPHKLGEVDSRPASDLRGPRDIFHLGPHRLVFGFSAKHQSKIDTVYAGEPIKKK